MIETGIYIRAIIAGKAESIDIADPHLTTEMLLRWLAGLNDDQILVTIDKVREAINANAATPDDV